MSFAILSAGDVVLVEHKPQDNPQAKIRPAIVLSNSSFNQSSLDVIVVPLTSQIRYGDPYQIVIDANSSNFKKTGLQKTSAIKCSHIFAYHKNGIKRQLGFVDKNTLREIINVIVGILS
jgi:mRNA-degrading endonuclease toxin of MazEF toxin-antitoxin module